MKTVPLKFQSSSRSSAPRGGKVAVRSVGVLKSRPSSFAVPSVVLSFLLVSALLSFNCSNKHEQGFVQFVEALSCSENNGECGSNSYCINVSNGAVSCTCWKGYQSAGGGRPGSNCVDIDECAGNVCPANSTCVNTPGSYECNCNEGFEKGENNDCIAQLRCSKDNDCDPIFAECVQLESKYECKCLQFFNGSGKVNECVPAAGYEHLACETLGMKCSGYTECKSSGPGQYTCQSRSAIGQLGTFFSEGPSSNTPGWIWAVVALGLLLIGVVIYYIIQQYSKPARAPEDAYITADAYLQYGGGYGGMGSY